MVVRNHPDKALLFYLTDLQHQAGASLDPLFQLNWVAKLGKKGRMYIIFEVVEGSSNGGKDGGVDLGHGCIQVQQYCSSYNGATVCFFWLNFWEDRVWFFTPPASSFPAGQKYNIYKPNINYGYTKFFKIYMDIGEL